MFDLARHHQTLPIRRPVVEPLLVLCLCVLAGLVWLVIGGAVMRALLSRAHAPRHHWSVALPISKPSSPTPT